MNNRYICSRFFNLIQRRLFPKKNSFKVSILSTIDRHAVFITSLWRLSILIVDDNNEKLWCEFVPSSDTVTYNKSQILALSLQAQARRKKKIV